MTEIALLLIALAAVELAVLAGAMVWRTVFDGRERKRPEDSGTEEKEENEDFEKRWRDGMRAMMGYDAETARRAARRDENEE